MTSLLPPDVLASLSPPTLEILLDGPAAAAPDGAAPDYATSHTLRPWLYVTLGLCIPLPTIVVAARIYTKYWVIRTLHAEDYGVVVAWVFHLACIGVIFAAAPVGTRHLWDTRVRDVFQTLYYSNTVEILYNPTIMAVKLAILQQYLRIFVPSRRRNAAMFSAIVITSAAVVIFYVLLTFLIIFVCSPRAAAWNRFLPGQCLDINTILVSAAVFNLVSDLVILALPQYSIWRRLQMARKHKMGIAAIFGFGALACVVTALRVQSTVQLVQTQDATWYLTPCAIWAIVEVALGIICCCLPVMPLFIQSIRGSIAKLSRSDHSQTSQRDSFAAGPSNDPVRGMARNAPPGKRHDPYPLSSKSSQSEPATPAKTWSYERESDHDEASDKHVESVKKPAPAQCRVRAPSDCIKRTVLIEWRVSRHSVGKPLPPLPSHAMVLRYGT